MGLKYNGNKPKGKNYSFKDGKFQLGPQDEGFVGPQEEPKTAIEKSGLIPEKQQEKAEKGWKEENGEWKAEDHVPFTDKPKRKVDELRSTLKDLGIKEKTIKGMKEGELSSSGNDMHPGTVKFAQDFLPGFQEAIGGVTVTGGNDDYHNSDKYRKKKRDAGKSENSSHNLGRALDITVPKAKAAEAWKYFEAQPGAYSYVGKSTGKPIVQLGKDVRIINEYGKGTAAATGDHFHMEVLKNGKWVTSDGHKD